MTPEEEVDLQNRVASLENQVGSLLAQATEDARLRRIHEEWLDTFVWTPAWKRWLFILDGWSGHRLVDAPRWRPWHRWWVS